MTNNAKSDAVNESNEVERLLVLARAQFEMALASMPDNFNILSGLGDVLYELAMRRAPTPVGGESHLARLELLQESLTHYGESLRAKDFSNVGQRVPAQLVRVLCELASDPNAPVEKAAALCEQAAVYASDALTAQVKRERQRVAEREREKIENARFDCLLC